MKMGKMYLILAIMAAFAMATTAQAGLVAHLDFNEGAGTTAADVTGNGHDGTLANVSWGSGVEGSAVYFDQAASVKGMVTISDPDDELSAGDLRSGGGWSVSLWTKLSDSDNTTSNPFANSNDLFYMEKAAGTDYSFLRVMSSGRVRFHYEVGDVRVYTDYASSEILVQPNEWTHIVVTLDGDAAVGSQLKFYINGADATVNGNINLASYSLALAGSVKSIGTSGSYPLGGGDFVDDLQIFNHTLSTAEVADLYSVPEPATLLLLSLGGVFLRRRG